MSLYDKASIALIPSGTNTSILYSVLPANGDGDFTHDRNLTTATRVNKDGLIESVAADVPRLDYPLTNGVVGDCPHLLLEPSRANLAEYSESFNNWGNGSSYITANQAISPDGNLTADQLSKTAAFQQVSESATTVSGSTYSFSIFVKENTLDRITLRIAGGSNDVRKCLDLSDLSISDAGGNQTGFVETKVERYPNEWYKYTLTATVDSTSTALNIYAGKANVTESGNIYIWGSQFELGDYSTSYIPNLSTGSTTRSADACNGSGTSAEFNDSEGVLFVEFQGLTSTNADNGYVSISDGTATNSVLINTRTGGSLRLYNGGIGSTNLIYIETVDYSNTLKIALQYGTTTGSYKVYINGISKTISGTFSATDISGLNELKFQYAAGGANFYSKIKQVIYFNEALTDSELETLTS